MIMLDFTGICFDAIMHPDRVTSKKAETSVTESRGNKGIWVERCSHKSPFSSKFIISEMHFMATKCGMFSDVIYYFVYSSFE